MKFFQFHLPPSQCDDWIRILSRQARMFLQCGVPSIFPLQQPSLSRSHHPSCLLMATGKIKSGRDGQRQSVFVTVVTVSFFHPAKMNAMTGKCSQSEGYQLFPTRFGMFRSYEYLALRQTALLLPSQAVIAIANFRHPSHPCDHDRPTTERSFFCICSYHICASPFCASSHQ